MNEAQLVRRAQSGDQAAFEALVNEHATYVYNLAFRIVHNPQEAEDLAQEAFLRVWKALPRFKADAQFKTWLYRIVVNVCYDRLPRLKREMNALADSALEVQPSGQLPVERQLLDKERSTQLYAAIKHLPESYRLVISLRHLQGLSYAEIAEVTGTPTGTVKSNLFRGLKRLHELFTGGKP